MTLVALFKEWRGFEKPPIRTGAPLIIQQRHLRNGYLILKNYRAGFYQWIMTGWSIEQQAVLAYFVWAEME